MSCTSDPTAGCDNSEIVAAIGECCAETNTNLEAGNTAIGELKTSFDAYNTAIETKLDSMITLLTVIANK